MAAPLPTGVSQQELNDIFADLVSKGEAAKQAYIQTHCLPEYLPNLADYQANQAPPIKNGDSVIVHSAADVNLVGSPGTAVVQMGTLVKVMLTS